MSPVGCNNAEPFGVSVELEMVPGRKECSENERQRGMEPCAMCMGVRDSIYMLRALVVEMGDDAVCPT
jgi:hypothetical protein